MSIISSTMLIDIDEHARHDRRKLLAGSEVEVLQLEGDLIGSWQKAIVINHSDLTRTVKYTNNPNSIQSIPVSYAIDGYLLNYPSQYSSLQKHPSSQISLRNNIRPVPYRQPVQQSEAIFGTCVDVFVKNAYFEGVIIDKQMVFLPDLGELENVTLNNLSFSLDFDEVTGEFKLRKKWMFLEALKENLKSAELSVSVRQIWYEAKSNPNFLTKIGVWHLGTRTDWDFLISNIMKNFEPVQANEFLDVVSDFVYAHQSKTGTRIREKQEAAQSYLISIGWQVNKTKGGNKYYVSKTGTRYRSFIAACEGYLSNQLSLTEKNDICDMNKNDICNDYHICNGSGTQKVTWKPVTLDPEYCCEIEEDGFNELGKDKIRKHLLYLGWVVEIKREKRLRYRYRSPKGNWYYSLRVIHDGLMCGSPLERESQNQAQVTNFEPELERERQNLEFNLDDFDFGENFEPKLEQDCQDEEANVGQNGEEFDLGENSLIEDIEPECLPNSIQEYIDFAENGLKRGIISPSDLRLNAKKHLLFNGWTRCTKSRSNRRPRMFYESPGGKLFCSLLRACKAFLQARFGTSSLVPVRVKKETKEERDEVDDKLLEHFKRKLDDLVQNNSPLEINENLKRRKRRNEVGVTKKKEKERRRMGF